MIIYPIASSSEGNSTLIRSENACILIDCGISLRALTFAVGLDTVQNIDAVFVTHEHTDHIKGIGPLGRKYKDIPIYINERSYYHRRSLFEKINHSDIQSGVKHHVKDLEIEAFPVEHDTANAYGFYVANGDGSSLCYLTDTGHINSESREFINQADILFVESNYDIQGLRDYRGYSSSHKARIKETHLSNDQTLELIDEVGVEKFSHIILGHLSPRTNHPIWVEEGFRGQFPAHSQKLHIAPTQEPIRVENK